MHKFIPHKVYKGKEAEYFELYIKKFIACGKNLYL